MIILTKPLIKKIDSETNRMVILFKLYAEKAMKMLLTLIMNVYSMLNTNEYLVRIL